MALAWYVEDISFDKKNWRDEALCKDGNAAIFFPTGTTGKASCLISEAKRICGTCPAQAPCLEFAVGSGQEAGIWGGLTEEERRPLRSEFSRKKRASA